MDVRTTLIGMLAIATKWYRFDAWENTDKIADYLIANGVTVQKWTPVTAGVPDGECIAVSMADGCPSYGEMIIGFVDKDESSNTGYRAESEGEILLHVTHWMPKPELPNAARAANSLTHGDKIRAMSNKELASLFARKVANYTNGARIANGGKLSATLVRMEAETWFNVFMRLLNAPAGEGL